MDDDIHLTAGPFSLVIVREGEMVSIGMAAQRSDDLEKWEDLSILSASLGLTPVQINRLATLFHAADTINTQLYHIEEADLGQD